MVKYQGQGQGQVSSKFNQF